MRVPDLAVSYPHLPGYGLSLTEDLPEVHCAQHIPQSGRSQQSGAKTR